MNRRILLCATILIVSGFAMAGQATTNDATGDAPQFEDVADQRGVDFECESWNKEFGLSPRFFVDAFFCPSPVIADVNGDGHLDLFFPNQRYTDPKVNAREDPQDALYLNNGDGTFREVTRSMDMHDAGDSMAGAPVDFDGDGDLDIYVANYPTFNNGLDGPSTTVYENTGTRYEKVDPQAMGLTTNAQPGQYVDETYPDSQFGSATAIADYDRDGDLDIYRGNYAQLRLPDGMPRALQTTLPDTNILYENQGDGTFTDATFQTGVLQQGRTFAANFVDVNEDGWLDLYVANDENPNELYLNEQRPGSNDPHDRKFVAFGPESGADDARGSMCSEPADFDNDGHVDFYMSHYEDELNGYHRGNGDGTFTTDDTLGDLEKSFHMLGWGCPAVDIENDGDKDLFVANAHMTPTGGEFFHDSPADDNGYALPNDLYLNTLREDGTHSFTEISEDAGPALDKRRSTSGVEAADLDRDGYREILAVNNNAENAAYLDDEARQGNHYLSIDLASPEGNHHAIGASVTVQAGDSTQTGYRATGTSMASGSVLPVHFGLGDQAGPAQVTVTWPDASTSTHVVDVDQHVRIVKGQGVQHDTQAPQPTVSLDGEQGEGDWFTSEAVTVELAASDPGDQNAVETLSYKIDDGDLQPYGGAFTLTGEGEHTITVVTEDAAGNRAWFPYRVAIDTQDPTAEITHPGEDEIRVQENAVKHPGGGTVQAGPVTTQDGALGYADGVVAGSAHELARQTGFDVPYPTSTREALAGTAGSDGDTEFRVDASDLTSGVDRVVFTVDGETRHVDERAPYTYDADLRGLDAGEHTVEAIAHDGAGRTTVDERTVHVVPSSTNGAQTSADDAESLAEEPDSALAPLGDPDPSEIERLELVDRILEDVIGEPTHTAEPGNDKHYFEAGQEPNPTRVGSYLPANKRDAPIWRQFSFISDDNGGTVGQYVVLNPDTFLTSPEESNIYQFPACQSLDPVISDPLMQPRPTGGEPVEWDRPQREIVNVKLETGCETQPESVAEVHELSVAETPTNLHVNAPKLPDDVADLPPEELFNAPPFRPKITAYQAGEPVKFITYEADWMHPWVGTNFPGTNDVLITAPSPTFRPDFSLFNVNIGGPNHPSFDQYSPIWLGTCIVPTDNQKCMIGANERAGFDQPRTSFEASNMDNEGDGRSDVLRRAPNTFTHINCPFVAVDQNGDDYIQPHEEIHFPNLWVDGPVVFN